MNFIYSIKIPGLIGISIYTILVLIVISSSIEDFLWTVGYIVQVIQDYFIVGPLMCLL